MSDNKRVLRYSDLKVRGIPYTRVHVMRMMKEGRFPQSFSLNGKGSAAVWNESDIDAWLADKSDRRIPPRRARAPIDTPQQEPAKPSPTAKPIIIGEKTKAHVLPGKNHTWITDGVTNKSATEGQVIPVGWHPGRTQKGKGRRRSIDPLRELSKVYASLLKTVLRLHLKGKRKAVTAVLKSGIAEIEG